MRVSDIEWKKVRDILRTPEGDFIWVGCEWEPIVYEEPSALSRREHGGGSKAVGGREDEPAYMVQAAPET